MLSVPPDHAHMILHKHNMSADTAAEAHLMDPDRHNPNLDTNKNIMR